MTEQRDIGGDKMTPAWKALVMETLDRRGWSRQRLAQEVGIGRATAYRLFPMEPIEKEIWSSTAVPEICAVLGLPPPMEATEIARDEQDRKILELVRSLPSETKQDLIRMIERLLPPSKG